MADLYFTLPYVVDLDKPVTKTVLYNLFVTANKKAHRFVITLRRGGADMPFTGSVVGTLINYSDMMTQEYPGRAEDGKIVFDWPASFYDKSGLFCVIITVDDGEVSNSVFAAEGNMILGETDTLYDPSNVVPSLAELLAQIEATRNAATAANNAANSANSAATDANSAADRANDAAQSIERLTVSASPGAAADAEITEQAGAKHIHFTLQTGATPNITFHVATGEPGTQVLIEQSGTAENPVVSLTIPRGDTGAIDGIDYFAGSPSALGTATPGTANGVARGDHVHPMPTAADVGALGINALQTNLLDNSYFVKPINQRGSSFYRGAKYTIDRWTQTEYSALIINNGSYVSFCGEGGTGYFEQWFEKGDYFNKTLTAAICLADGSVYTTPGVVFTEDEVSVDTAVATANLGNGCMIRLCKRAADLTMMYQIVVPDEQRIDAKWAAIYEGAFTAETLQPYVYKGYAAELAECQRYYVRQSIANRTLNGYYSSGGRSFIFPIPVEMRALPTVAVSGTGTFRTITGYALTEGYNTSAGGELSTLDVSVAHYGVLLTLPTAAVETNNTPGTLTLARDAYIEYSADL